jgi:hypothetical protein
MSSEEIATHILSNAENTNSKPNSVNFEKVDTKIYLTNVEKADTKMDSDDVENDDWVTVERKGRHRQKRTSSDIFAIELRRDFHGDDDEKESDAESSPRKEPGMSKKKSK